MGLISRQKLEGPQTESQSSSKVALERKMLVGAGEKGTLTGGEKFETLLSVVM